MKCTPDNTQCPLHKELVASDARYQARIKELEAVLAKWADEIEQLRSALDAKITICGDEQIASLKAKLAALGE